MPAIFIAATDTGVGKTVITGMLARFLLERRHSVITQKWIQTGTKTLPEDVNQHLRLMKIKIKKVKSILPYLSPYRLKLASSPHLAARLERKVIRKETIKRSFKFLSWCFDYLLVEGIGGVLVPFNEKKLIIDLVKALKLPVLIVSGNRLGAINHTLLTIEALKQRKIKIIGVIFNNQTRKTEGRILKDNPRIIKKLSRVRILGTLPRVRGKDRLYKKFIPFAKKIMMILERQNK